MRVRNATALALAETAIACHSGTSVDTAVHAPPAPGTIEIANINDALSILSAAESIAPNPNKDTPTPISVNA